jgi:hypothetical protein
VTPDTLFEQLLFRVAIDPDALAWVMTLMDIHQLPETEERDADLQD